MASGIYNRLKSNLLYSSGDLVLNSINCALMTATHSFNADNNVWSDVSTNEISAGGNYSAGGAALASKTVTQNDGTDKGIYDAADVVWSTATISNARFAVLYDNTLANKSLVACFDFGANYSSTSGDFTIVWNASGIITLS